MEKSRYVYLVGEHKHRFRSKAEKLAFGARSTFRGTCSKSTNDG